MYINVRIIIIINLFICIQSVLGNNLLDEDISRGDRGNSAFWKIAFSVILFIIYETDVSLNVVFTLLVHIFEFQNIK